MRDTGQHYRLCEVLGWHVPARALIFFSKQDYGLKSVKETYAVTLKVTSQYVTVAYHVMFTCSVMTYKISLFSVLIL